MLHVYEIAEQIFRHFSSVGELTHPWIGLVDGNGMERDGASLPPNSYKMDCSFLA